MGSFGVQRFHVYDGVNVLIHSKNVTGWWNIQAHDPNSSISQCYLGTAYLDISEVTQINSYIIKAFLNRNDHPTKSGKLAIGSRSVAPIKSIVSRNKYSIKARIVKARFA